MATTSLNTNDRLRLLFDRYAAAVAMVEVKTPDGSTSCGTAYHVGDNVFLTARHVVDGNTIERVVTTTRSWWPVGDSIPDTEEAMRLSGAKEFIHIGEGKTQPARFYLPSEGKIEAGPFYHRRSNIDLAAFRVSGIEAPAIPLGTHLDDWIGTELILQPVLVMGYPTIPLSDKPVLVATVAEVNAIIDRYIDPLENRHPHFILSTMARGGFSGGVALTDYGESLGVITESLLRDHNVTELGYLAVLTIQPILDLLDDHRIVPLGLKELWGKDDPEFWSY